VSVKYNPLEKPGTGSAEKHCNIFHPGFFGFSGGRMSTSFFIFLFLIFGLLLFDIIIRIVDHHNTRRRRDDDET